MKLQKINKRKLLVLIAILILFFVLYIINGTLSKYNSLALSNADIKTAIYILKDDYQTMNLNLNAMIPSSQPYIYKFSISNNDGKNRTETNLEYELKIRTTTNLPLEYELYLNEEYSNTDSKNIITGSLVKKDEDDTYFKNISIDKRNFGFASNETDIYTLVIKFDEEYSNISYQNIIESVELEVSSKQII